METQSMMTFEIKTDADFKIVCGSCERRVKMHWSLVRREALGVALVWIECHGQHRLVQIYDMHARVAALSGHGLVLLWEQLHDVDACDQLAKADEMIAKGREWLEFAIDDVMRAHITELVMHARTLRDGMLRFREQVVRSADIG